MPKGCYIKTEEHRNNLSSALKGKSLSAESRRKISDSLKGRTAWNKGTVGLCKANSGSFKKGEHRSKRTEFKKGQISREKHPQWKGGVHKLTNGYLVENCPGHPRAYRNEVYQHILVAEKKLGRYLNKGEVVHHLNGIKDDNREENIVVCVNNSEHIRTFHARRNNVNSTSVIS